MFDSVSTSEASEGLGSAQMPAEPSQADGSAKSTHPVADLAVLPLLLSPSFEAPGTPQPKSPEATAKYAFHSESGAARLWEDKAYSGTEEGDGTWVKKRKS